MLYAQNFEEFQDFLKSTFQQAYQKQCKNFNEYGRLQNQISLLFIENEIRIFYSIPKCEECDIVVIEEAIQIKKVLQIIYNWFSGNIDLSAHITYNDIDCPIEKLYYYLPDNWKQGEDNIMGFLKKNSNIISCSLCTSPSISKEILFTVNTYDMDKASIFNVIDGNTKNDFIPRFFSLVSILYRR